MKRFTIIFAIGWIPSEIKMPTHYHAFRLKDRRQFCVPYQQIVFNGTRKGLNQAIREVVRQIRSLGETVKLVATFEKDR